MQGRACAHREGASVPPPRVQALRGQDGACVSFKVPLFCCARARSCELWTARPFSYEALRNPIKGTKDQVATKELLAYTFYCGKGKS